MVMTKGYDKISLNYQMLLDLRYREGAGTLTRDIAKPHHDDVDLVGVPAWAQVALSNLTVLDFDGAADYLECPAADTADLDFTTGDYSVAVWVNKTTSVWSNMVVARYGLDLDGWEIYLDDQSDPVLDYLTMRHHHNSLAPNVRDGCFSTGWAPATWWLLGITRNGAYPKHFRDGAELEVTYEVGGLADPDACNRDLVVGCRFTKDANFFPGQMWGLRIWDRELSAQEMWQLFRIERSLFGV